VHHKDHAEIVVLSDGETFGPAEGCTVRYVPEAVGNDAELVEEILANDGLESERVLSASDVIDVAGGLLEPDEIDDNPEYFRALIELCNQLRGRTADQLDQTVRELRDAAANGEQQQVTPDPDQDPDDARAERLSEAGAKVVDALAELYFLNDGDEMAVGEQMYEIDKAARRRAHDEGSR
jgi:hypothetical protein